MDLDISLPLPLLDHSAQYIFTEHCIEHITPGQAWDFLCECRRVLVPGGTLRVAFPDISKIVACNDAYRAAVKAGGFGDGSVRSCVAAALKCHGHKGSWTTALMIDVMESVGFKTRPCAYGQSEDETLRNVEGHWKVVGRDAAESETGIVEGIA